jgi:outer membrane protein assembly factor BamB
VFRSIRSNGATPFRAAVLATLAGLLVVAGASVATATHWTRFQSPAPEVDVTRLPEKWSPTEGLAWSTALPGYGQSSPVTWGDTVYVTAISGPNKETCHVLALNRATGTMLWQRELAAASPGENSRYMSRAAPTPLVDDQGLYCFFEGGNLLALTPSGETRWARNLVEEFGDLKARHGLSSSLEALPDRLFVWVELSENPYVLAVEKSTGKTLWKVPGIGATSWSTPRLLTVAGKPQLLLSAVGSVTGLSVETGERLWTVSGISGNSSPTPIPAGEGRFIVGATAGRGEPDTGKAASSNGLVKVTADASGQFQAEYAWRAKRATCSFGSPLVHLGEVYFVNASGVVYCLDLESGEERYAQRLSDSVWATPFAVGDRLFFSGKGGTVSIVRSGPTFELIAENKTWDDRPATAAETPAETPAKSDKPAAEPGRPETGNQETGNRGEAKGANPGSGRREGMGGPAQPTLYATVVSGNDLLIRRGDRLYCVRGR